MYCMSCPLDFTEWLILYTPPLSEQSGCSVPYSEEKIITKIDSEGPKAVFSGPMGIIPHVIVIVLQPVPEKNR